MMLTVKQFNPATLHDYKTIRLEALENAPDAFSSDFEMESVQGDDFHLLRLQTGRVYGAYDDERVVGMIGVIDYPARKMKHRAALWGVYVSPVARGRGSARALMETALAGMPAHVRCVTLGVGTHNDKAIALYKAMGFEQYGLEKMALIDGDKIYDEYLMVKFL